MRVKMHVGLVKLIMCLSVWLEIIKSANAKSFSFNFSAIKNDVRFKYYRRMNPFICSCCLGRPFLLINFTYILKLCTEKINYFQKVSVSNKCYITIHERLFIPITGYLNPIFSSSMAHVDAR